MTFGPDPAPSAPTLSRRPPEGPAKAGSVDRAEPAPRGAGPPHPAGASGAAMLAASADFGRLGPEICAALSRIATPRRYGPNEFIYLQDDEARSLYVVVSGHVRLSSLLEDGSVVLHAVLPPGEVFGELGAFEGTTYCDMATAIGPAVVAGIAVQGFDALAARHPELRETLARVLARRYRGYVLLTRDLSLKTLSARLAQSLLRLSANLGTRTRYRDREVAVIGSAVTQADLGLMSRGSRGNVNRLLKAWERLGLIAIADRSILVLNAARLEGLTAED
jgi:CRP/FNR family transcriptional regulator, cyclic AMP receptor protein